MTKSILLLFLTFIWFQVAFSQLAWFDSSISTTLKPTLTIHATPTSVVCATKTDNGLIKLVLPTGITSTPLFVPKSVKLPWTCNVTSPFNVILSSRITGYNRPWDWNFQKVNIVANSTLLGLGLLTFSNQSCSIQIPIPSLSKSNFQDARIVEKVSRPSMVELSSHLKFWLQTSSISPVAPFLEFPKNATNWIKEKPGPWWNQINNVWMQGSVSGMNLVMDGAISQVAAYRASFALKRVGKSWRRGPTQLQNVLHSGIGDWIFQGSLCFNKPIKANVNLKQISRIISTTSVVNGTVDYITCVKNLPYSYRLSAPLVRSLINVTMEEAPNVTDVMTLHSGTVSVDNLHVTTIRGVVYGLSPKTSGYKDDVVITGYSSVAYNLVMTIRRNVWNVVMSVQPEVIRKMKIYPAVHLANPRLNCTTTKVSKISLLPCVVTPITNETVFPMSNAFTSLLTKATGKSQFVAETLLQNLVLRYTKGSLNIKGTTALDTEPFDIDLTWTFGKLFKDVVNLAQERDIGKLNIQLADHPCLKVDHQAKATLSKIQPVKMPQLLGSTIRKISLVDVTLFNTTNATSRMQCGPVSIKSFTLQGPLVKREISVALFDNIKTKFFQPVLQFDSSSSHLVLAMSHPTTKKAKVHLLMPVRTQAMLDPQPHWQVVNLEHGGLFNSSVEAILGGTNHSAAKQFKQAFHQTNSKLIQTCLTKPNSSHDISYGFLREGRLAKKGWVIHELFYFGRTSFDRLRGKQVRVEQRFANLTGIHANVSIPPPYKPWKPTKSFSRNVIGSNVPIPNFASSATSLIPTLPPRPPKWNAPWNFGYIATSNGTSSRSTTKASTKLTKVTSTKATITKATTTKKPKAKRDSGQFTGLTFGESSILDSNDLPVVSNAFAYIFPTGGNNGTLSLSFRSGYEACPPEQQVVVASFTNSPIFGNVSSIGGHGIFNCDENNDPVSFAAQLLGESLPIVPMQTSLNLVNASMQVNCVPDANLCFWPPNMELAQLYSWGSALNTTSYWDSINGTQMLLNGIYGTDNPTLQQQMLNNMTASFPNLQQSIQGLMMNSLPSFLVQDPLSASLIAQSDYRLPIRSFQCSKLFSSSCTAPSVVVSGRLQMASPKATASGVVSPAAVPLVYGGVYGIGKGLQITRQTLAVRFSTFGYLATNISQDVCGVYPANYFINVSSFLNLDAKIGLGTLGVTCQNGSTVSWQFSDTINSVAMQLPVLGNPTNVNLGSAKLVYTSINDTLTVGYGVNGFWVQVGRVVHDGNAHVTFSSTDTSLSQAIVALGQSAFVQLQTIFQPNMPSFSSFTGSTILKKIMVDYDTFTSQTHVVGQMINTIGQTTITSMVDVLLQKNDGWSILSELATINVLLDSTGNNWFNASNGYIPCASGVKGVMPGTFLSGSYNFILPSIGLVNGNVTLNFTCANDAIASVSAYGNVAGPLRISTPLGLIQGDVATFGFDSNKGYLNLNVKTEQSIVGLALINGTLQRIFYQLGNPTTATNGSLPFASTLNNSLASLNWLDGLLQGFMFDYNIPTQNLSLAFDMQFSSWNTEVALSFSQGSLVSELMTLQTTQANVTFVGIPCYITPSVKVSLLSNVVTGNLLGTSNVSCINQTMIGYSVNVTGNATINMFGATQNVLSNFVYDSTSQLWVLTGKAVDWNLKMTLGNDTTLPTYSLQIPGTMPFGRLPFALGLQSVFSNDAILNDVSSLTFSKVFLYKTPTKLTFAGSIAYSYSNFNAGGSVLINMQNNSSGWSLTSRQFTYNMAVQIGNVGLLSLGANASCPKNGFVNSTLTLNGIKELSNFNAIGSVQYVCDGNVWSQYSASLQAQNVTIQVFDDTYVISSATILFDNVTNVLQVSGAARLSVGIGMDILLSATYNLTDSVKLLQISAEFVEGTTSLFSPNVPFGGLITGSLGNDSLVSQNAQMAGLIIVYTGKSLNVTAEMSIGSLNGSLALQFALGNQWNLSTSLTVQTQYGQFILKGRNPCKGGMVSAEADLNLPVVGSTTLLGQTTWICNGSNIVSYQVNLTSTFQATLFNQQATLYGMISYDSNTRMFGVNGTIGPATAYIEYFNSSWIIGIQVFKAVPFNQLPFVNGFGVDVSGASQVQGLQSLTLNYTQFQYFSAENGTLFFTCQVKDDASSWNGLSRVQVVMTGYPSWSIKYSNLYASLLIDNFAEISFSTNLTCPALATASLTFLNLPLDIPLFTISGDLEFDCTFNKPNWTMFSFSTNLNIPLKFTLFDEQISLPTVTLPTINYTSWSNVFDLSWYPTLGKVNVNFPISLKFGKGLPAISKPSAPSVGRPSFPFPFTISGQLPNVGSINDIVNALQNLLPSWNVAAPNWNFPVASLPTVDIANKLGSISLPLVTVNINPDYGFIYLNVDTNMWNVDASFYLLAFKLPSQTGWSSMFGLHFTEISAGFESDSPWLDNLFGPGSGISFGNFSMYLATGSGTFTLPFGLEIQVFQPGFGISGQVDVTVGNLGKIVNSGPLGQALDGSSLNGQLDFSLGVTSTSVSLLMDVGVGVKSGSDVYANVYLQVLWIEGQSISFGFLFSYTSKYGTQLLEFIGGVALKIDDLGAEAIFELGYNGIWNNPMSLSPYLTVYSLGLNLGVNLESLLPSSGDFALSMTVNDPVDEKQASVQGILMVDVANPTSGTAVSFSLSQVSLATIVNLFSTNIPAWAQTTLESMSIDYASFSFNPSTSPSSFSIGNLQYGPIAPGLSVNVTNLNFFNLITISSATLMTKGSDLSGSVVVQPIKFGSLFSFTGFNGNGGPMGSFAVSPSFVGYELSGEIQLFGMDMQVDANLTVDPLHGKLAYSFEGQWQFYGDTVTLILQQQAGLRLGQWRFHIEFDLDTSYGGGFFAAILNRWNQTVFQVLNTMAEGITNYVNQQAAAAIQVANNALNNAINTLQQLQAQVDAGFQAAEQQVDQCQATVNHWEDKCDSLEDDCSWLKPWDCIAAAGCKVSLAVAQGALFVASQTLVACQTAADDVLETAENAVALARNAVDDAIAAGEALVDGIVAAVTSLLENLASSLASSLGTVINLQSLHVQDTLWLEGQNQFSAIMTAGFFGSNPQTYSFYFNPNDIWATIRAMIVNGVEQLAHYVTSKLVGTPAQSFSGEIRNLLITSATPDNPPSLDNSTSIQDDIQQSIVPSTFVAGAIMTNDPTTWVYSASNKTLLKLDQAVLELVDTATNQVYWSNDNSFWNPSCPCTMTIDVTGNWNVFGANGDSLWSLYTGGSLADTLQIGDDGILTLLASNLIIWVSTQSIASLLPGNGMSSFQSYQNYGAIQDAFVTVSVGAWGPFADLPCLVMWIWGNAQWSWCGATSQNSPFSVTNTGQGLIMADSLGTVLAEYSNQCCKDLPSGCSMYVDNTEDYALWYGTPSVQCVDLTQVIGGAGTP